MVHSLGTGPTQRAESTARRADAAGDQDRALIARIAAGDERALGLLYERWVDPVHALAIRIVGDRDDAEDVVEETFWQAWRRASSYDDARGSVATWLLVIARARALDRRRQTDRRRTESLDASPVERRLGQIDEGDVNDALATAAPDPALAAETSERRTLVAGALAELPVEQRETLELAYFGGLSQSEIAEQTGQPLGTVKTRMRLAMHKLREKLSHLRTDGGAR